MAIAAQKHAKIVKPSDNPLKLDPIHQENYQWCFVLANVIEKSVLKILCTVRHHYLACSVSWRPGRIPWP
jgi:hypothetical protein